MKKEKRMPQKLLFFIILLNNIFILPSQYKQTIEHTWLTSKNNVIEAESMNDLSGFSVDMNGDGTILIIGEPGWSGDQGRARIYQFIGDNWTAIGNITGDNPRDNFGNVVTINDQGNIIAIGAPGWPNGNSNGQTKTFIFTEGNWSGIGNITGENSGDKSGYSLAVNQPGDFLIVCEPGYSTDNGRAKIFQLIGGSWSLTNTETNSFSDTTLGYASSLDNTQNYIISNATDIIISKDGDNTRPTSLSSAIKSLSYNGDGNIFIAGAPDSNEITIGRITQKTNGKYDINKKYIKKHSDVKQFGQSVKTNQDGNCFIIGAPGVNDGHGYFEIYIYNEKTIYHHAPKSAFSFGYCVSSDNTSDVIVVGAPGITGGNQTTEAKGVTFIYRYRAKTLAPNFQGNNLKTPNRRMPGTPTDISQPNHGDTLPIQSNI